jgi:hypothetical protein
MPFGCVLDTPDFLFFWGGGEGALDGLRKSLGLTPLDAPDAFRCALDVRWASPSCHPVGKTHDRRSISFFTPNTVWGGHLTAGLDAEHRNETVYVFSPPHCVQLLVRQLLYTTQVALSPSHSLSLSLSLSHTHTPKNYQLYRANFISIRLCC